MDYFGLNNSKSINSNFTKKTNLKIVKAKKKIPWSGYMADYAIEEIYKIVKENIRSIIFVNTRAQAELLFQNGQIISSAVIVICFAGMIAETLVMRARKSKSRRSKACTHPDDELSATEFYEKHAEDAQDKPPKSKKKAKKKTEGKNDG